MPRISHDEKERVRRRLLASAARHFAEKGLGGANINQISVDAGCARGTVYNYFESKEQLFSQVLAVGSAETLARYRARAIRGDTRAHLLALTEEDATLVRAHEAVMKTFVRELVAPGSATQGLVLAGIAPLVVEVAGILARGQERGEVRVDLDSLTLSRAFLGQLTMAYVQAWSAPDAESAWEELPALTVTLFLDGAASSSQGPPRSSLVDSRSWEGS